VILGEAELEKKNYQTTDAYLREAKKVARGYSVNLEWLSFQAGYLTGDYAYACAMLESAMKKPGYEKELRALASDPRFSGMEKRPYGIKIGQERIQILIPSCKSCYPVKKFAFPA
jgi:hypothetical protein